MVYHVVSLFDYNYTLASILGLCFYGPLPEQTLGVPTSWALVVIPLSPAVHSVFDTLEQNGSVLPYFAELDFLFPSGALVGYGVPVLELLASTPCLVWRYIVTCVQDPIVVVLF
jgi:hypothetical protein